MILAIIGSVYLFGLVLGGLLGLAIKFFGFAGFAMFFLGVLFLIKTMVTTNEGKKNER
jgi:hypothetical protein